MGVALALGEDPAALPRSEPTAGVAASLVYRAFSPADVPRAPGPAQRAAFAQAHPDALMFSFPKTGHALERDFKWTGNHHFGFVHLGGFSREHMLQRAEQASALLGWTAPCWTCTRPPQT
jgi:hypothetical protein